jgi:hypothetical protein
MGRFLSADPVRGDPAQPQSLNLYAYVRGNPLNAVDPDGRAALWLTPSRERAMAMAASEAEQFSRWAMEALSYTTWVVTRTLPFTVGAPGQDEGSSPGSVQAVEDALWNEIKPLAIAFFLGEGRSGLPGPEAAAWVIRDPETGELKLQSWGRTTEAGHFTLPKGSKPPQGTVAQIHTHPVRDQLGHPLKPSPSTVKDWGPRSDEYLAQKHGIPVYSLSQKEVWVSRGIGRNFLIAKGKWWELDGK